MKRCSLYFLVVAVISATLFVVPVHAASRSEMTARLALIEAVSQQEQKSPEVYRIKSGDTLQAISQRVDVGIAKLVHLNRIPSQDYIITGHTLRLRGERRSWSQPAPPTPEPSVPTVSTDGTQSNSVPSYSGGAWGIVCSFGWDCDTAMRVLACESGGNVLGNYNVNAVNGQYLGAWQMGSSERATYGHASDLYGQTAAAYRYYQVSGWSPWSCY